MWLQRFFRRDPPTITITTTSTTSSHTDNTNANGNGKPQRESLLPEDIASLELGIPEPEPFPSQADFFRYRKQRGVNLGSWFVLESWITPTPFRFVKEPRQSDLDIARGSYAKQVLERHWDNWMTESDWIWLAKRGINTVRIPIGYYHICGADPSVLNGTDFSGYRDVYGGAWYRITNAIVTANRFGIGVLIDLHAAPGKQNPSPHSGTSNRTPTFFTQTHISQTHLILSTLLTHLSSFTSSHSPPLPNLIGIHLLNEPQPAGNHPLLYEFYKDCFETLWSKNPWIPISISDSWLLEPSCAFLISQASPQQQQQRRQQHQSGFLILDHHLYRCFTKGDAETSVERHVEGLRDMNAYIPHVFARVGKRLEEAGCGFVIGEWSGALNPLSFKLSSSTSASASASASAGGEGQGQGGGQGEDEETLINAQRKKWVSAQMELYEKSCSGHFFWTYKKEETPGGGGGKDPGWSLRDAVEAGVYPSWVGLKPSPHLLEDDNGNVKKERTARRDSARTKANGDHLAYWTKYEGEYEHWRFGEGFTRGWDDAYLFFTSFSSSSSLPSVSSLPFLTFPPIPELGFKGPWMKKRIEEHVKDKGDGKALWEFEHGFSQGLVAARKDLTERAYKDA